MSPPPDPVFTWRCSASRVRRALAILSLAVGLLGGLVVGGGALAATPVGSEFQVNTFTTGDQTRPAVAVEPDGGFVVAWYAPYAPAWRRFDSDGNALGPQHCTEAPPLCWAGGLPVSVAVDADGDFVVARHICIEFGDCDVFAERFDASGSSVGGEFQVNTSTIGDQMRPAVAVEPGGSFVVVWESDPYAYANVHGQRFDAIGNAVGAEFQVNSITAYTPPRPRVAVDPDGDFVVVWQSLVSSGSDNSFLSIQGQRYGASGSPVGSQFQVNTYTTSTQEEPSVAVDTDGDFVVVWQSNGSAGSDTDVESIQGQRYDASGSPLGGEFQVNTHTTGAQLLPSVAAHADGDFAVVWSNTDYAGVEVHGQLYHASGIPLGSHFQVNTYTTAVQGYPAVGFDADGEFVVVWQSDGSTGNDSSGFSIQGQRYGSLCLEPGVVPNALASVEGNTSNLYPFGLPSLNSIRYQQVFSAAEFPCPSVPRLITGVVMRPDGPLGAPGSGTIPNIEINLSTTAMAPDGLATLFDTNLGADLTWVYNGSLPLSTANTGGPARDFDIVIPFQTPFWYDPAAGNLLLDVWNLSGGGPTTFYDAENTFADGVSRVYSPNSANDPSGVADSLGLVVQFTFAAQPAQQVPSLSAPGALGLAVLLFGIASGGLRGRLRERA